MKLVFGMPALEEALLQDDAKPKLPLVGRVARLRDDASRLDAVSTFSPGDLLRLKPGLGGIFKFEPDEVFLFRRYEPDPPPLGDEVCTPFFCERGDAIVAVLSGDDVIELAMPSRRLELHPEAHDHA